MYKQLIGTNNQIFLSLRKGKTNHMKLQRRDRPIKFKGSQSFALMFLITT